MRNQRGNAENAENAVAVAIDKDKGSQYALKWAVEHLISKGQTLTLIHVKNKASTIPTPMGSHISLSDVHDGVAKVYKNQLDSQVKELFLPFRAFCTRKDIKTNEIILDDVDIGKSLCDYIKLNFIENLVVGAPSRNSFVRRFRGTDVPTSVSKGAPDFCTVYVISKGKITSVRSATSPVPNPPPRPLPNQVVPVLNQPEPRPIQQNSTKFSGSDWTPKYVPQSRDDSRYVPQSRDDDNMEIKSPFNRVRGSIRSYPELPAPDLNCDISYVSSGRPSFDRTPPSSCYDSPEHGMCPPRLSYGSDTDNGSDSNYMHGFSSGSEGGSTGVSWSSSQNLDDVEAEMRRLRQELRQTMDMYSSACKEALTAKQRAMELQRWKAEEQQRLESSRLSHESALVIAEKERAKTKAAIEAAEAAHRIAELEAQKRKNAEQKALKEAEEKKKVLEALANSDVRYRKYTIEEIEAATDHFAECRKIGEGGYGPVYKCYLDHTPAAIKILRPDAAQGRSQFQQEVEVLSTIRHPNMVLLLGACPEYGCLVYEYMSNGSLEDRLMRRGNSPPLSWQARFRISAEIATALLFLHQTKPEPLVHRDLKPANILLDRNFVSKISDVGLARLVPPSVADTVTQYRMTTTAGTFCYIDPEYQQTGMLGIKSDIYSLGIMLLQIITARSPMGLTHHVEKSIERGTFAEMLDQSVPDWPVEEALGFAKLALQCAELRRKDRPDLKTVLLPELNRLRALAEDNIAPLPGSAATSPSHSQAYMSSQENISGPTTSQSGYASSGCPLDSSYTSDKMSSS